VSTIELQEQLISKIKNTTNEDVLQGVLSLLEFETNNEEIYIFNEEEKKAIEMAQQQVAEGRFYTDEEADKLMDKWLKV